MTVDEIRDALRALLDDERAELERKPIEDGMARAAFCLGYLEEGIRQILRDIEEE